jgi:hypothetical protein
MVWHGLVMERLRKSGLFTEIALIGAKLRAFLGEAMFLDIHYDPTSGSYSYGRWSSFGPLNVFLPWDGAVNGF